MKVVISMMRGIATKLRLRMLLMAITALMIGIVAVGCAEEESPKAPIKIVDTSYETQWIYNAVFKFIVESAYDYPVEPVVLTVPVGQVSLSNGDVDAWLDLWWWYYLEWYDPALADGKIENLGPAMEPAPSFWMVPKYTAEEHNIKTIEDMKRPEVVKLFSDPEEPSKGRFVNCPIGWECQLINRIKMEAYGLTEFYNIAEASAGGLDAELAGAQIKKKPVFGYYWAPTSLMGKYEWSIVEEPKYTDSCWDKVIAGKEDESLRPIEEACAYEAVSPVVGINAGLRDRAPEVVAMLEKSNIGLQPVNVIAAWAKDNEIAGEWDKAALQYLKLYENRWTTWMPADKVKLVKEAMANAGS